MGFVVRRIFVAVARAVAAGSRVPNGDVASESSHDAVRPHGAALRTRVLESAQPVDFAQKTGFDLESLVFCFAIGGVGSVLYNALTRRQLTTVPLEARELHRHRMHRAALLVPIVTFLILYWLPWNPIYPALVAMAMGGLASTLCRPDLTRKALVGGGIFLGFYAVFMVALLVFAPGYIEQVWNLPQLTGIGIFGIPMEELLFGFTFGMYWTSVYEHLTWRATRQAGQARPSAIVVS